MKPSIDLGSRKPRKAVAKTPSTGKYVSTKVSPHQKPTTAKVAVKIMKAATTDRHGHEPQLAEQKTFWYAFKNGSSSVRAHDAVVAGMPGHALEYIFKVFYVVPPKTVLNAIGVSERTAHRIKANPDKLLDARTTDAIYRLESVRATAEDVLGSAEAANEWLNTEAVGLESRKPIDLLSTSPGAEAVKTLLQRMKWGVYA